MTFTFIALPFTSTPSSSSSSSAFCNRSSISSFHAPLHSPTLPSVPHRPQPPQHGLSPRMSASSSPSPSPSPAVSDRGDWDAVLAQFATICPEVDPTAVEKLVARAFGWGTQKFWRGRMKKQPASTSTVQASLDFLRSVIGLDDAQISKIVPKLPEVLALPVTRMQENVNHIQRTYPNIKDRLLVNAIVDSPAVLGYDFDCEGDCKSECARCWVQF